jgi:hypothetical protein
MVRYVSIMQTIGAFDRELPPDYARKQFLAEVRWPDGVKCPHRGEAAYTLKARPFHYLCKSGNESTDPDGSKVVCSKQNGYRFSVLTRTILQDTKLPLKIWFKVAYLIPTAKKGISALQVHRVIFGDDSTHDYHTTWYMCFRWRAAMKSEAIPLTGQIEIDETFVGGKAENMHRSKREKLALVGTKNKVAVIGAIARKGMVVAKVVENTDTATLDRFLRQTVGGPTNVKLLAPDGHSGYRLLGKAYDHRVVRHSAGEYVVASTHANTIESFWSLFKRGIMRSYHKVSNEYLPFYVNAFPWRFNNRKNPAMFADLIQSVSR